MADFAVAKACGVRVAGLAACVPSRVIRNREAAAELYGDDIDGVIKATGVAERRAAPEGEATALDLCDKAASFLFEKSAYSKEQIGAVVFVTSSPDYILPNNSTQAQHRLGLGGAVAAFDVSLACSGYVYGLWTAALAAASMGKSVLLLDGETNSQYASTKDKATALLFGDAGTATIIEPCGEASPWTFAFETDGSKRDALIIPEGGYKNRANAQSGEYREWPDGGVRRGIDMKMDGMEVFNFVVRSVPKCLDFLMQETGTTPDGYDALVLHQANLFMIRQVAKKMKFAMEKVPTTIQKYGNSSSATIPVTLASELREKLESGSLNVLMSGFGAGLSLASVSMPIGPCCCPGVIEHEC